MNKIDNPINDDTPEIAKEIVVNKKSSGVSMEIPFTPYDHTTANVPVDTTLSNFGVNYGGEKKEDIGYFEGVSANWQDKNETWRIAHGTWSQYEDATLAYKDPNFNPMQFQDKFLNIRSEYQPYLLASENEKQMDFRLNRIYNEQNIDDKVKNGSWMQWLSGGALAIPTDLISYIPVIGQMKYARFSKTFLTGAAKNIPGAVAFGTLSSAGEQIDKINGNMHDFMNDSVIRSVFATALFGAFPVVGLTGEKLNLWKMQSYISDAVKGIGYKFRVGEKGELKGLEAYDMTPNKSLSSDSVRLAQDKADSSFYKGGIFKYPYIGAAAEKLVSNTFFGSPVMSMLTSPLQMVRAVADLSVDHGIITKGLAEGNAKPIPFFTLMQQTLAHIKQEQVQFNALHMERNGVKTDSYISQSLQKAGMYTKQKTLEKIQAEIGDRPYVSESQFSEEVQSVIRNEVPHENSAVNEAAAMYRTSMDRYYSSWRKAYNLPEDWMPPKTARAYLMRVYDLNHLNNNLHGAGGWVPVISNELRKQDNVIIERSKPINDLEQQIKDFEEQHTEAVRELGFSEELKQNFNPGTEIVAQTTLPASSMKTYQVSPQKQIGNEQRLLGSSSNIGASKNTLTLRDMKIRLKSMKEELQNEIRSNENFHLLADDWNNLSANEANELKGILKPINEQRKVINEQEKNITQLKAEKSKQLSAAKSSDTAEKAKPKAEKFVLGEDQVSIEAAKLEEMQYKLSEMEIELEMKARKGEINRVFFTQGDNKIKFKNPDDRLKFRKTYHEKEGYRVEEEEAHMFRQEHAKAYYDTIMNQTAEDTINQIMGKFTGNQVENHVKQRTLNIPDEVLYQYNFLTKDLPSKVANYKMWLARRTNLQNVYKGLSIDGGFEPIIKEVHDQFDRIHSGLNEDKAVLTEKLANKDLTKEEKKKLDKALSEIEDNLKKSRKDFNRGKEQVQFAYEKMMGISKLSKRAKQITQGIKSFNVFANLGFLTLTMISDLSANGLKQGFMQFIQSGVYPVVQSLGGLLKTHDSQSLRNTAGALNLALHHIGNTTASRQIDLSTNPYLNLGRIPAALDKIAHFSSNANLTTAIDNGLQYVTSAVAQSNVISHMHSFSKGTLTKGERMWLNKYGLDPEKDAKRILEAFKKDGGGTNKLGGYQSNFWHWEDTEIANKVSDAVFRSTHDTIISANALDSPIWLDENGPLNFMAPIIRGFKGWAFASLNRYLIPTMQSPDAQKLMGFAFMTAMSSLVSPSRRIARGQDPYSDKNGKKMESKQIIAEILLDSPQFAWISSSLQDANMLSGGTIMGEIKNDKYRDRSRIGVLGPTASNTNKLFNFIDAMATGNMNEHDVMGMASMIPIVNSMYGYNASKHIVENFGLPKYRPK